MYKIKSEKGRLLACCLAAILVTAVACTKYDNYKTRDLRYGLASEASWEHKTQIIEYVDRSKKYIREGNYIEAYTTLDTAYSLDKNNRVVSDLKSTAYLLLHKPGQAFHDYILFEHNKNEHSKKNWGGLPFALKIYKDYPDDVFLERARQKEELRDVAFLVEGLKKLSKQKWLSAEKLFTIAIEHDPSNGVALMGRGTARGMAGKVEKAEEDFAAAEKLYPDSTDIAIEKALIYVRNGRPSSALEIVDRAIEKDPECFDLVILRSSALLNGERYEEAEKNLGKIEKRYYDWWHTKMLRGVCAENLGDTARARELYAEADKAGRAMCPDPSNVVVLHQFVLKNHRKMKTKLILDEPYDIEQLLKEVVKEMFKGDSSGVQHIEWTDKLRYDKYSETDYTNGTIRINRNLNSSQIPKEHIKMVIYYECLYAKGYTPNDRALVMQGVRYPGVGEIKNQMFLDTHFRFEMP